MSVLITIAVALVGWKIAEKFKLPVPIMLGSMIAVGITNIIFSYAYLPLFVRIFAQSISGAFIGAQISKSDILNIKTMFKPFLFLISLLTVNTFVMGLLIHSFCGIDLTTALLSCVAGGVTDISLIAMDMNANAGIVALMQTSRLVFVLLFFSYWIRFMTRNEVDLTRIKDEKKKDLIPITFLDKILNSKNKKTAFTLITSCGFGYLGYISKMPAATMVFPMAIIILMNCTTSSCIVPKQVKNIAQLLAGSLVGTSILASTFTNLNTTLVPVILLLISYWFINIAFSFLCKRWGWLDLKSAMLASAPGGATDMSLIAADLNADLTKIALIQVLRAAYVVAVMPFLISLFIQFVS